MRAALAALLLTGCAVSANGQVVTPLEPPIAEEGPGMVVDAIGPAFTTVGEMMGGSDPCVQWRRDPEWVIGLVHHILHPAKVSDQAIIDHANGRCA